VVRDGKNGVKIVEIATGKLKETIAVDKRSICSVTFSPDGRLLALGSTKPNATVMLRDVKTGTTIREWTNENLDEDAAAIAFSPKNDALAVVLPSGLKGGRVRQWELASGKERPEIVPGVSSNGGPWCAAYGADGTTLYTGGADHVIRRWHAATGKEVEPPGGSLGVFSSLAASPVEDVFAAGNYDGNVYLMDHTGKTLQTYKGQVLCVRGVAFSPDGTHLASTSNGLHIWNVRSGTMKRRFGVTALPVAFGGNNFVVTSTFAESAFHVFDVMAGVERPPFYEKGLKFNACLAVSRDGLALAGPSPNLWNVADAAAGKPRTLPTIDGYERATQAAWHPDGSRLAVQWRGPRGHIVHLHDVRTGKRTMTLDEVPYPLTSLAWSPDGRFLAATYRGDGSVRIWDPATGNLLRAIPLLAPFVEDHNHRVNVAFTHDSRRLLVLSAGQVFVLRLDDGKLP
jgi:WD40 repeat protein